MEEMEQYRQHLDWHFRLNKREKEAAKINSYRKWYFELNVSRVDGVCGGFEAGKGVS